MSHVGQNFIEYVLLAATSLFIIIDPIALVPIFLAMTPRDTPAERIRMARLACIVAAAVLTFFCLVGEVLFKILGISMSAFKIAGALVLLVVALDMLRARRSPVQETEEETYAGAAKDDIAITPLGIPMLAGPGAISTAILLRTQATGWQQEAALIVCILLVCLLSFQILRFAAHGVGWISPIAMNIVTRIMGLLLAAVAIQFILDAIAAQKGKLF